MAKTMTNRMRQCLLLVALAGCLVPSSLQASQDKYYHYYYKKYYGYDKNEAQGTTYKNAHSDRDKDVKTYEKEHPIWVEKNNKYQKYLVELDEYQQRLAKYTVNKTKWQQLRGGSGAIADLTIASYAKVWQEDGGTYTRPIISNLTEAVEVPSFTSITTYRDYCQNYSCTNGVKGGSLVCENKYSDSSGTHSISFTYEATSRKEYWSSGEGVGGRRRDETLFQTTDKVPVSVQRTVARQQISGGYAGSVYPFTDRRSGISDTCEESSVVLIGTYKYPIKLNGPVYIDGDVIIRGFVKGQGSIYAGRNIHVIGDITYYDPPSWPHDLEELKKSENCPTNVMQRNATKDLLLLAARGNIIVGDYTSVEWTNETQMAYLDLTKSGRTLKPHTTTESDIGYSSGYPRNKNYTEEDGGKTVGSLTITDGPNRSDWDIPGVTGWYAYYIKTIDCSLKARNRRYYESSLGGYVIQNLKQTTATVGQQPTWRASSSLWKRILAFFGLYQDSPTITDNIDSGDVTEIDAILYANHGIFGVAGGTVKKKLHLNGALICKDEGLLTSFAGRFPNDPSAKAWLNWDMRIKSDLKGGVHIGAPENLSGKTKQGVKIKRITWNYAQ